MGYESKIYVVKKGLISPDENRKYWAEVISMFVCEIPGLHQIFKKKSDLFIFSDDGETKIYKDAYGDDITEATISEVIGFLESKIENENSCPRIRPLLALLKSFESDGCKDLVCLHYCLHYGY